MADDYTEHQTQGGQLEAEKLSLQTTTPPSEVPGYQMERFIGAGAFGQVWVARDLNTGRRVAIKFYLHRGGVNWSLLSREVKNLVAMSADRHIVQVLEVGWDAEPPFYAMEYVENGSLEDMLRKRGRVPLDRAVELFREICVGLNHTHGKGILHCDLKPANVLLDEDFRPRLADFGQSRLSHEQTPALGTLFYMAPEQADLDSVPDVRWDIYALGAILYRMITGTAPHREGELLEQIDTEGSLPKRLVKYRESIVAAGPPGGHRKVRGVDRRLASIIETCLQGDPQRRYATVQQVIDAIDERSSAKARRPLILLGIVGPLLLLGASLLFVSRTIRETGRQFTTALTEEGIKRNLSASAEKARAFEIELRGYFDLIAREASNDDFTQTMRTLLEDENLAPLRDKISRGIDSRESREQILSDELCKPLDDYLSERLEYYNRLSEVQAGIPKLATIFVTDRQGTIIGIAYAEPVPREANSSGKNYAYRTYFHGQDADFPKGTLASEVASIVQHTHLSAAFQSTATGLWKVAVSTPVRLKVRDSDKGPPFVDGVFVATTNFGDFRQFQTTEQQDLDLIGVLVDARDGENRGTILQHPWMTQSSVDHSRVEKKFKVPSGTMDNLLEGGVFDYVDPIASTKEGAVFAGDWIAAVHRVHLPQSSFGEKAAEPQETQTDWLVMVQFRLSKAIARVDDLTDRLITEGFLAAIAILIVNAAMWLIVRRLSSPPRSDDRTDDPTVSKPSVP